MFSKNILLIVVVSSVLLSFNAIEKRELLPGKKSKSFIVGFYNVENLFDTIDDPHKNDNQFLPDSKKKWNSERYYKKLNDLSRVIYTIDSTNLPVVFGLSEVENKAVVEDLIHTDYLKDKYEIIHKESPDGRGIDVAVIFQPKKFKVLHKEWIRFQLPNKERPSTRDIVYVQGLIMKKDTLNFFFCHWPSRYGGEEKSRPYRAKAAKMLKAKLDSLRKINPDTKILVMGDLNDHPDNEAVQNILEAKKDKGNLINLMWPIKEKNEGTHFYKGHWGVLDHIIVSASLLKKNKGLSTKHEYVGIHKPDFLLYTNKKGVKSPSRTYGGNNYYGGFSDHLAIYLELKK